MGPTIGQTLDAIKIMVKPEDRDQIETIKEQFASALIDKTQLEQRLRAVVSAQPLREAVSSLVTAGLVAEEYRLQARLTHVLESQGLHELKLDANPDLVVNDMQGIETNSGDPKAEECTGRDPDGFETTDEHFWFSVKLATEMLDSVKMLVKPEDHRQIDAIKVDFLTEMIKTSQLHQTVVGDQGMAMVRAIASLKCLDRVLDGLGMEYRLRGELTPEEVARCLGVTPL